MAARSTTRPGLLALIVGLAGLLMSCGERDVEEGTPLRPSAPAQGRPNFVIIVADDLGSNEVGYGGNTTVQTPNIDRLAGEGITFTRAFVPASMCSPSRAALYTGLYPHRNGLSRNHSKARGDVRSLPHHLTPLGYRTVLVGKSHVGPFDTFPFERRERRLKDISAFIDSVSGAPFAMVIAQHHPHVPWLPNRQFDPDAIPLPANLLDTPETREAMADYYTSVKAADAELGAFLDLLEDKGLSQRTVVVFLSDHGPQFPFAKFSNYDAGLRIPLVVRWPEGPSPGRQVDALVGTTDIVPTLIEIAGGSPPPDLDGRSLVPLMRGETDVVHEAVYGTHSTLGLNIKDVAPYGIRSVRTSRYRYIRNLHPRNLPRSFITEPRPLRGSLVYLFTYGVWVPPGLPRYWESWLRKARDDPRAAQVVDRYLRRPSGELYDLENDPGETTNLAANPEFRHVADQMNRLLVCWMRQQGDPELGLIDPSGGKDCDDPGPDGGAVQ